ncbi:MAG: DNA-processing protein DprA [Saprospiraceae bacterium]
MNDDILLHNIALSTVKDIGPKLSKHLISYCGSAEAVFTSSVKQLSKVPGIGPKTIDRIKKANTYHRAEKEIEYLHKTKSQAISFHEKGYPHRLKHYDSSPLVLYYRGNINLNHPRTVAIIGTRKPTDQGKIICDRLVADLESYGIQVISGLAYGIDTCAHKKSVDINIPTIGVMGHGLDLLYPATNKKLSKQMQENGGLLTEFPIGTNPDRENFPMRNRIIASMSDVVVVVESKKRGGSIITAEFANNYNKDVFAFPGRINDESSEGCNRLIKQHKANLLESAADIGYIMRWDELDKPKTVQTKLFIDLTEEDKEILEIIKEKNHISIDEINYRLKVTPSVLASLLLNLEFKGAIRSLPGKKYALN